jgi:hypothetical protein
MDIHKIDPWSTYFWVLDPFPIVDVIHLTTFVRSSRWLLLPETGGQCYDHYFWQFFRCKKR